MSIVPNVESDPVTAAPTVQSVAYPHAPIASPATVADNEPLSPRTPANTVTTARPRSAYRSGRSVSHAPGSTNSRRNASLANSAAHHAGTAAANTQSSSPARRCRVVSKRCEPVCHAERRKVSSRALARDLVCELVAELRVPHSRSLVAVAPRDDKASYLATRLT